MNFYEDLLLIITHNYLYGNHHKAVQKAKIILVEIDSAAFRMPQKAFLFFCGIQNPQKGKSHRKYLVYEVLQKHDFSKKNKKIILTVVTNLFAGVVLSKQLVLKQIFDNGGKRRLPIISL